MSIRMVLSIVTVLLIIGGCNLYLAKRFYQFFSRFLPNISFSVMIGIFLLPFMVLTLGFARSLLPLPAMVKHALGIANAYWMGIFFYLLLFFALSDVIFLLVRLFLPVDRFLFPFAALTMTFAVSCYGFIHASQIKIKNYDITIPGAENMTVVLISDVHLGAVGSEKRLPKIVEKINSLEPDLVCIAGDFFDSDYEAICDPESAEASIRDISAAYGVWACLGNHDAGHTVSDMRSFLDRCGIGVLNDEYVTIENKLVLAGRPDSFPIGGFGGISRQKLSLDVADPSLPVVVMDHNPANIHEYSLARGLILCGHTHRGQIFPCGLITDRIYTADYGYYRLDESSPQVIVSSGVGTWGMPMRVGTDSEIVKITLHS